MDKYASATETRRNPSFSCWKLVGIKDAVHLDKQHSRHEKAHQYVSAMIYTLKIYTPFITNMDGQKISRFAVTRLYQPSKDRRVRETAPELLGMLWGGQSPADPGHRGTSNLPKCLDNTLTAPHSGFVLYPQKQIKSSASGGKAHW